MRYNSLNDLISVSRSSREFFLALPVSTRLLLHQQNEAICSAHQLKQSVDDMNKYDRTIKASESLF